MNEQIIQALLPTISKALGRDISAELNLFYRARAAIGDSLNPAGQEFFMKNWPASVDFMETQAGKVAIADFMGAWAKSLVPKTMAVEHTNTIEPE